MAQGGAPRPTNPNTISTGRLAGLVAQAPGPKQKPRRGAGLSWSCLAIQSLPISPEDSKPTTLTPRRTVGCTRCGAHEKAPPGSGAKLLLALLPERDLPPGGAQHAEELIAMGL